MKNLFIAVFLSVSTVAFSQIDFRSTRYGIVAGGNYSRVRNAHNPSGPLYGFQGGLSALTPVDSYDQFYIQTEVLYYQAGESGKDKEAKGRAGYDATYRNNYISVPIMFKGFFSEAESEFFAMAGPRFNFLLNQKVKDAEESAYEIDNYGAANKFNLAVALGVGFSYKRKVELTLGYDIGLSNTYPDLEEFDNVAKKKSEQVISLKLNYIFD